MSELDHDAPEEVDLLVFGAGAGGMTAALKGALDGLSVLLCEKTDMVGGTTATSGGTVWIPGAVLSREAGVPDTTARAAEFLRHVEGNRGGDDLRTAFLETGPDAIAELQEKTDVQFVAASAHPDYLDGPGSAYGGRALSPLLFDGRQLGADFARVRPPRDVFMGLGGMMVGRAELGALLGPFKSLSNFRTTLGIVLPYFRDRLRHRRGTRLLMGNALVGRLLLSLRKRGVPIWFESRLVDFLQSDGRVTGAVIETGDGRRSVLARLGVVLATGGIGWNEALRKQFYPSKVAPISQSPISNRGDGISLAVERLGAALDDGGDSAGLWMPCSIRKNSDGSQSVWPHILLDRAKPGLIAVGPNGRRFVNEADSYHDFCSGMVRAGLSEAWLIVDSRFIAKYGLGLALPGGRGAARLMRQGYLIRSVDLADLARSIGVDPEGLKVTIALNNQSAAMGRDNEFRRGDSTLNRFNGDASVAPNPCLAPIATAPFYAVKVMPVDLAGSAGLRIDADSRVLDPSGSPISGLYACGNDATSIFRGTYPGPGTTIGPAMVFAWRAATAASGSAHSATRNLPL
ncbi:FAD-binding protein [Rhizobium sullae]|uniref:FAD-binding dehydrogenase n=1 Tax=Rhizobium sullae TaxID=50338 RepID=A0A2N0D873_RHISU|nr:FAD-binding protein [Rhizobium sullae]PKA42287.1 FAD-binding dehydrogenase [Rhizobium sullae]TCU02552.1 succinate dehydrogenase/fumarate reductase flavoprotein subunit [Rhizobium sullae]